MNAPDLPGFLLARIAEDEAVARRAVVERVSPVSGSTFTLWEVQEWEAIDEDVKAHTDRHDPARVLAECAATREIVELTKWGETRTGAMDACRALSRVWADHPEFDPSWADSS